MKAESVRNTYATTRLRSFVRSLGKRIDTLARTGKEIPPHLTKATLSAMKTLDDLERAPSNGELRALKDEIEALKKRISGLEAEKTFRGIR